MRRYSSAATTLLAPLFVLIFSSAALAHHPLPPEMTGNLFVSSYYNDRVCVYTPNGTFVRDFTGGGLTRPRGLVMRPEEEVYVSSQDTDAVLVFGPGGNFRRALDPPGLDGPTGLASGPNGRLYACAANSNRVYVFDDADQWSGIIQGGGLSWPNGVAVDVHGDVYVTSVNTDDVRKYSADGTFITAIGGGDLDHPTGLAISPEGILYVAGSGSNNVAKYTVDGTPLGSIEHADFASPQSLAIDDEGRIYISQFFSDAIVIFSADGSYEQTLPLSGADAPRGVAFLPLDPAGIPGNDRSGTIRPFGTPRLTAEPSPFHSTTRLRLQLPIAGKTTLALYDLAGRPIRILVDRNLPAGTQLIDWDGCAAGGRYLPSGVYFARVRTATGATALLRIVMAD